MATLKTSTIVALGIMIAGIAGNVVAGPKVIKIGVQAPITGQYASEGQGIENAVKLLVKEQNADGGLLGRQIVAIVCDDEGQAAQAVICARKLVNAGVVAVIGTYTSGAALVAGPVYARANVIQNADGSSTELTTKGWKTFFRNGVPNSDEARVTADFMVKHKGYKRIVVLTDHSDFGVNLAKAVVSEVKRVGGTIVDTLYIDASNQEFTPVLTKIKSEHPDALYFSGYYSQAGLIRTQMKRIDMKAAFVGNDTDRNTTFVKIAGPAAAGSFVVALPAPEDLPYPSAKKFLTRYKDEYGTEPPSIYTLTNADGLRAIFAAIKTTESTDPSKLETWLHNMPKPFPGFTGPFKWAANGERIGSPMVVFEIQPDGSYQIVYRSK